MIGLCCRGLDATFASAEPLAGWMQTAPQPFRLTILLDETIALANKVVGAATAAGFSAFGLRVSRLLRFCPLAMPISFAGENEAIVKNQDSEPLSGKGPATLGRQDD